MSKCVGSRHFRPAIPTRYNGFLHDSKMEARLAEMLDENGIKYFPHRTFDVVMRDGMIEEYTPDFVFLKPQKLKRISVNLLFVDVFGYPNDKVHAKMHALEYTHDCNGYIVTSSLIDWWCRYGILADKTIPKGRKKGG